MELSDEETEDISHGRRDRDSDDNVGIGYEDAEDNPDARKDIDEEEDGDTKRRIDPSASKKRIVKNPQPKLNAERIQGPKGIQTIEKYFEGFKYHGKKHEKNDLNRVMKRLEHWAHRLFPKYCFDDFIEKMEVLGNKKNIQVVLKKYRLGMLAGDEEQVEGNSEGEDGKGQEAIESAPVDEFDKLIAEQIEKQRAHDKTTEVVTTGGGNVLGTADTAKMTDWSEETKMRVEANRKLALERKMARTKRLEEESKRRKLEESQEKSEIASLQSSIHNVSSTGDENKEMECTRKMQPLEEPEKDTPTSELGNVNNSEERITTESLQTSQENICAAEISPLERNSNNVLESSDHDLQEVEIATEVSAITNGTEGVQGKRYAVSPQSQNFSSIKASSNEEKLLSPEELLLAIDEAMEEIIGGNGS